MPLKSVEPIFNHSEDWTYPFERLRTKIIGKSNAKRKFFKSSKVWLGFGKKGFLIGGPILTL